MSSAQGKPLFRYADGRRPNLLAMAYVLLGFLGGLALLPAASPWLNALGTLLLAHAMIVAAYFLHEFAHASIFSAPRHNAWAGTLCSWLCGSCYADFADLRDKHLRHHAERADVVSFDPRALLRRGPRWLQRLVLALEWAWIPALEVLMHLWVIALPFATASAKHRRRRGRVAAILLLRSLAFALLGWLSLKALLLYTLAWLLMLGVLRFADAYQHTYDAIAVLEEGQLADGKLRDRAYEQRNTYSNLVSQRWPLLNLLLLNFAYHNAHHAKPAEPWHRLPALHERLFGAADAQLLPMRSLLPGFHRHRLRRLLDDDYGTVGSGADKARDFYGAVGVSFLTAV